MIRSISYRTTHIAVHPRTLLLLKVLGLVGLAVLIVATGGGL
jgi:hypothetical protein